MSKDTSKGNVFKKLGVKIRNSVVGKFFRDLVAETKKVVWPSKKQVVNNTLVVLAVCLISGVALFAIDSIFGLLLQLLK
jgi:preprotein translocase subunit SecE